MPLENARGTQGDNAAALTNRIRGLAGGASRPRHLSHAPFRNDFDAERATNAGEPIVVPGGVGNYAHVAPPSIVGCRRLNRTFMSSSWCIQAWMDLKARMPLRFGFSQTR